ncbi:hypothetical protein BJ138DRAFT_1017075 [Hygrophoropsis aurantiaca]|uniref:Uncharacterized protein n=1 Tax=Hygrophoropsis aurantiaca TaxID=72124 RepID=A0ACB7ZYT2_9AGAM|nr:hypothetical protein BJ138DRAFT_1017075 [Hygrophoropsis aurantiaca]
MFAIGSQRTPCSLVSSEQLKGHLRLLRAFHNMRITVEDCKDPRLPALLTQMDKRSRWTWFVTLAVDRFERWVKNLQFVPLEKFTSKHFPPLDVWMVWHAYLLNPCWYAEDCERLLILQQLRLLNMFVVASINVGKLARHTPSEGRTASWHKKTGTYFDPFEAMADSTHKQLECPRCRTRVFVPFANDNCTGYAEEKFAALCPLPGCRLKITRSNLAVAKFARDLIEHEEGTDSYMAGTLYNAAGKRDARQAKEAKELLTRSPQFSQKNITTTLERIARLDWEKDIKESVGYSLQKLKETVIEVMQGSPLAYKILNAYQDDRPFSIDLVEAVLRQGIFTKKMGDMGWLQSAAFKEGTKARILEDCIARYHGFLDLMASSPGTMFVPTLDIDLVWHSHQLMASRYLIDCEIYVGRSIDHEHTVEESRLSLAFDETCHAWLSRFHVPYMQCGCPPPDETVLQKLIRILRTYTQRHSNLHDSLHVDHLPATHPSTHNVMLTFQRIASGSFGSTSHHRHAGANSPGQTRAKGKKRDDGHGGEKPTFTKPDLQPPMPWMETGSLDKLRKPVSLPVNPAPPYITFGTDVRLLPDV